MCTFRMLAAHAQRHVHLYALAVMLVSSGARLWLAASGQLDLAQDEAQYWDWSRTPQLSYYSKGPLIAWIIAPGTALFGDTELGVRSMAVCGGLATQMLLYFWLAGLLRRPLLGLLALCLANTTPLFIAGGVLMTTDNPLLACWTAGLVCLTAITERPGARWPYVGLALAVCLGILAKYMMLAFVGTAMLYLVLLRRLDMLSAARARAATLALGAGAVCGLAPVLLWNLEHDFASFRHVARLAGLNAPAGKELPLVRLDRFPEYAASQAGLVLPWWLGILLWHGWSMLRACLKRLRRKDSPGPGRNSSLFGAGGGATLPDPVFGSAASFRLQLLLSLGFWPLWLFFLVWSFHTRVYPNWPAMAYAAGIVIAALGVGRLLHGWGLAGPPALFGAARPCASCAPGSGAPAAESAARAEAGPGRRLLPLWWALSLTVCLGIYGQHLVSGIVPAQYNPATRLKGWSDLGRTLEELRRAQPDPHRVFFFSDAYDVTAALRFYVPDAPPAFCADFGRRLNQYDFWPDPNGDTLLDAPQERSSAECRYAAGPRNGWTAIFVSRKPISRPPRQVERMFAESDPPVTYQSRHLGQPGRAFGIVVLRGFSGCWPRQSQGEY